MIRADHGLLLAGCAAAGFGAVALTLSLTSADLPAPMRLHEAEAAEAAPETDAPRSWAPLFGTPPPAPVAAPEPEPPQPAPDYTLRGLVAAGDGGWAIVAGPEGERMVRVGTELPGGAVVAAIDAAGVSLDRDGRTYIVGFAEDPGAPPPVDTAPPPAETAARLSLKELRDGDFRRMLGLAGGVQVFEYDDGLMAQEIVWVRNGRLYDRIGLQAGDIVLTINGFPAGDTDAILDAASDLARQREFTLELIRAGARMTLKVSIDEDV